MWYRTGTVSVSNGSTAVTGTGTDWISGTGIGEGFLGPDGKLYEISVIVSATSITLGSVYLGSTASGQPYQVIPSQSYIRDLANQAAALVNSYSAVQTGAGAGKFGDGTVGVPGVRFAADEDTGMRRVGANSLALVAGGVDRLTINAAGVNGALGATTPSSVAATTISATGSGSFGVHATIGTTAGDVFYADATNTAVKAKTAGGGVYIQSSAGVTQGVFLPTGLAVTGALSATGLITATGGQIAFPATQMASSDANTLDDYEEGTWTGTITAATPPTVPPTATGWYTKKGREVTVTITLDNKDTSGGAGQLLVTGLPFAAGRDAFGACINNMAATAVVSFIPTGQTYSLFYNATSGSTTNIVAGAGKYVDFTTTYFV